MLSVSHIRDANHVARGRDHAPGIGCQVEVRLLPSKLELFQGVIGFAMIRHIAGMNHFVSSFHIVQRRRKNEKALI